MRVLAVSPHLDDAVFSVGALLAQLTADGHQVTLLTVFTQTVADPQGFALACQLDKGLGPEVDYMALRREEDRAAARVLGLHDLVHLPFAEAPHRGYASAPELFGAIRPGDSVHKPMAQALRGPLSEADLVLAPLGLGGHVDHRQVTRALGLHATDAALWHDEPYALKAGTRPAGVDHPARVECQRAKLDACATYSSQVGFQFGGVAALRRTLSDQPERLDRKVSS